MDMDIAVFLMKSCYIYDQPAKEALLYFFSNSSWREDKTVLENIRNRSM